MQNFANQISTFVNDARPIIISIVAASLLILGLMFIWPNERSKEAAKTALPWVVFGCALALGATSIASALGSSF